MSTNILEATLNLNGLSGSFVGQAKVFNERELELRLNFVYTSGIDLTKLKITFDGKTRSYEFDDIKTNYILKKENPFIDIKREIIQIRLFYNNFSAYEYIIPLIFISPSTLDYFDGAVIQNAQFIDTKENDDLFFVMKNNKDQLFNFRSGSNVITYRTYLQSISAAEDEIIPILTATLSSSTLTPGNTAFIENEFGELIEVTT